MSTEMENKLALLKKAYTENLPEKILDIEMSWQGLSGKLDSEKISLFHRKIHNLHGSAGMHGFQKIGELAAQLEHFLTPILTSTSFTEEQKNQISQLLIALKAESVKSSLPVLFTRITYHSESEVTLLKRIVYSLDDDKDWASNLAGQLQAFGYQFVNFDNSELFMKAVIRDCPAVLLMDINLLNEALEKLLFTLKQKPGFENLLIIFTANNGQFSLRLKAVQLGGEFYLLKPFLIDELITQLDRKLKQDENACRVLIVDDELDTANYYSAILENANMITAIINKSVDVDQAVHDFKPDLLLIDLYMPDCSGMELAAIIRQQSAYESVPIIFLSAEEDKFKQLNAMKLGGDDFVSKSTNPEYLVLAVKNRASRYKTLRAMMVKDNLTGVFNHSFIVHQLDVEMKETTRQHNALSVVMIDLDNFKKVNDTYTHLAGDQVLRGLCLMIRQRLREADLVGRYGGEEFLIILPNTNLASAEVLINAMRQQFSTIKYSWQNQLFNVSFSAGIASFPEYYGSSSIIQAADEALYQAKSEGRNKVAIATNKT